MERGLGAAEGSPIGSLGQAGEVLPCGSRPPTQLQMGLWGSLDGWTLFIGLFLFH